jgi:hypothetical protein
MRAHHLTTTIFLRSWRTDAAFWVGYTLLTHLIFSPITFTATSLLTSSIYTLWHVVASYAHLRYLYPLIRERNRLYIYLPGVSLVAIASAAGLALSIYGFFFALDESFAREFFAQPQQLIGTFLGSTSMALAITGGLHGYFLRRETAKRQEQLEREKIATELNYLRSQINPHFLFNALNSIYFLIKKDPDRAADSLAGFSELLRYQLYRGGEDRIPLREELEQLERYTDLARLRHGEELRVRWDWPDRLDGEAIPPLLLLPLVENACKHVRRREGYIHGEVRLEHDRLVFCLRNNCEPARTAEPATDGGIGLANIRRRLELLFPDDHQLLAAPDGDDFHVQLHIPLS